MTFPTPSLSSAASDGSSPSSSSSPDNTSVRVCVRVRPLLPYELTIAAQKVLSYPSPNQLCIGHHSNPRPFTFDFVFDDFASQQRVYSDCVQPLVDSFTAGYNTTILAYGQTGSGKTHTMGTAASDDSQLDAAVGIIPRVIRHIFATIREREQSHLFTVKVAFLEIYNEEIFDLLSSKRSGPAPYIREGPGGSIIVANTLEEEVGSYAEMLAQLVKGSQCRVTGSTQMNATSSRSHAIFTIILSQRKLSVEGVSGADDPLAQSEEEVITSKFHFVDLAGSERLKRTGAVGDRMKEGININQGLLALGNCISALGGEKKALHVPFRDSKITRLLQDSLGGNSKTLMIACVSPADVNADETLNTLKYANRAKNIQNKPVINRDPNSAKIDALRQRIAVMEAAIGHWREGDAAAAEEVMRELDSGGTAVTSARSVGGATADRATGEEVALLRDQRLTLEAAMQQLTGRMKGLREEMSSMSERLVQTETERDVLRLRLEKVKDGEVKQVEEGDTAEVGVLEDNRRTIQRLSKKVAHQKRELDSAMKVIAAFTKGEGAESLKRKRRRTRRKTASATNGGELGDGPAKEEQSKVSEAGEAAGHEEKEKGGEDEESDGPDSVHSPHEVADEGSDADDVPLTDLSLTDADSGDEHADALSLLAELKEAEHEANIRQWTAEGVRLNLDLTRATKELKDYHAQSANVLVMRVEYEKKISEMEREMESVQAERDRVLRELESSQHVNASEYEQRYEAAVTKYRAQLGALSVELKATREKLKENERMKRQLAMDEVRINKLEAEIAQAKKAKVTLAKKMEESAGKYREWCEVKEQKLAKVVKESRKQSLLLKKMESDYAKQGLVLQRRNEEKALLQKQISRQAQQHTAARQHPPAQTSASTRGGAPHPASAAAAKTRSPPSTASSVRPPRSTPLRRQPPRRNRESPLARAKAMAANAAALSDSAAPQHATSSSGMSEEMLKVSIEQEIAAAVERAGRMREVEELRGKKALLQAELNRVQERMMSNEMVTAAQQAEYSQLEAECVYIQSTLTSVERAIRVKEGEMAKLMPQPSPVKGKGAGKGGEEAKDSVFLSGSDVDYRLFSRIKVGSLDVGKRALVYLIHQAVELSVERGEMGREVERLQRELEEERRKAGERGRVEEVQRKRTSAMKRCTVTSLQVHYAVEGEDDGSPSHRPRPPASPIPVSPRSPHSFSYQLPNPTPPPLTNNFLSDEPSSTTDLDHSGATSSGSRLKKGPTNVFARLTDTSSFTGMYRSIAEEGKKLHPKQTGPTQPKKPPISFAQQPKGVRPMAAAPHPPQPVGVGPTGARDAKWVAHLDSPLLNWPPAASLGGVGGLTAPPSSLPSVYHSVDGGGPGPRPAGSVFSRLTNPQLYTGAHRARFGLDVQTKHKAGEGDGTSLGMASAGGGPLALAGAHGVPGPKGSRITSPSRTHSRVGSSTEYAATFDSAHAGSALPTITDTRAHSASTDAMHSAPVQQRLGQEHDEDYLIDIRRQIRMSVERDEREDGGEEGEEEPTFHFGGSQSPAPRGEEDKENHHLDHSQGLEAEVHEVEGVDGSVVTKSAAQEMLAGGGEGVGYQHWPEGVDVPSIS